MPPFIIVKSEKIVGIAPPPPGVSPNFDHPKSIGYRLVITVTICLLFSTAVLIVRLYTKRFIVHIINADDYTIIAAQLLAIAESACTLVFLRYGFGKHAWDVPFAALGFILKWGIGQAVTFSLSIMLAKISILLLYLRLSPYRYFRIIVYGLSAIILIYSFVSAFQFLFDCTPMAKYWDTTITDGSCIEYSRIWVFNAVMNSSTDVFMLFLPVWMMWEVRIPRRQKIGAMAILMVGVFVLTISIIRLHYILQSQDIEPDATWEGTTTAMWGTIELNVGIICACLPHFKPFIRYHLPKFLGNSDHSENLAAQPGQAPIRADALLSNDGHGLLFYSGEGNHSNNCPLTTPPNEATKSINKDSFKIDSVGCIHQSDQVLEIAL